MRAWLPGKAEFAGVALALTLGLLAWTLGQLASPTMPWLSDVVIAIGLGFLILNSPLRRLIGLADPRTRMEDRWERGLRYTGKWLLRLAIILMGLQISTDLFQVDHLLISVSVLACSLPAVFLVVHAVSRRLGLRRELGDLLGMGTMVCGASAINALAPVIVARRRDQGLAIAAIFVFSVVALLAFRPIAIALELPPDLGGLWAGLAVNDFSSSVAVGRQIGEDSALVAAASKSLRVLMLGPLLVLFGLLRRPADRSEAESGGTLRRHFPLFVLGYLVLFGVRVAGDAAFAGAAWWSELIVVDGFLTDLLILTVCAGIGLHIHARTLWRTGTKAVFASACASFTMAGVSLAMLVAFHRAGLPIALLVGASALLLAVLAHGVPALGRSELAVLRTRFLRGTELSLREARDLLGVMELQGDVSPELARRFVRQIRPAIGEIQPLRSAARGADGLVQMRAYWTSSRTGASLVGGYFAPGAEGRIVARGDLVMGRLVEGQVELYSLLREPDGTARLTDRGPLGQGTLLQLEGDGRTHLVRNTGDVAAVIIILEGAAHGHDEEASVVSPAAARRA